MADGKVIIETDLDSKGFESSLGKLGSIAQKGSKVAIGAVAGVVTAVSGIATASIKVGMDFESSMSQVAATMGITSSEIANGSESFELLKNAAKEAGSTTQFSASQSAEALNYLALAGYDAEKSVEALPKVLNLAAAGGLDLGYASDLVTDSMSALGLKTEELEGFVDKLAKTSQKSNTSVGQLGEGILTVGGTAKVLAGETTELNAALGILADNGVKGAEGGTALRNIILSLTAPTDKAAGAMKSLGLEVLDAEGNMRPLDAIFGDLNDKLSSMSKGDQTKVLNKIFNKVDLKSVNALLSGSVVNIEDLRKELSNMGVDVDSNADSLNYLAATFELNEDKTQFLDYAMQEMGITLEQAETLYDGLNKAVEEGGSRFDELSGYIDNADGAAANMAETMNDNLKGQLTQLSSALEGLGIDIYEQMEVPLKDMAKSAIESVGTLHTALKENGLEGLVNEAGNLLGNLVVEVANFAPKFIDISINLIKTFVTSIQNNLPQIAQSAISIIKSFVEGLLNMLPQILEVGISIIGELAKGISSMLPELIPLMIDTIILLVETLINNADLIIDGAIQLIIGLAKGLTDSLPILLEKVPELISSLCDAISDNTSELIIAAGYLVLVLAEGIIKSIPSLLEAVPKLILAFCEYLLVGVSTLVETGQKLALALWNSIKDECINGWNNIVSFFTETIPGWIDSFKEWWNSLPEYFQGLWDSVIDTFSQWGTNVSLFFTETIPKWIDDISNWFNELPNKIGYAIGEVLATIVNWGVETYNYFSTNIPLWIENISTWFSELPNKIKNWFNQCIQNVIKWGTDTYNKAKDYVNNTIDAVVKYFSELPNKVWTWLNRTIEKLVKWGDDMVKKAKQAAKETFDKIVDGFKKLPQKMADIGKSVVEGIWKGITGAGDWLWGKISGFAGNIVKGFKDNLKINSPSKIMRDKIGVGIVEGIEVGIDKEMPNLDDNVKNNMKSMTDKMRATVDFETSISSYSILPKTSFKDINNQEIITPILSALENINNVTNLNIDGQPFAEFITPLISEELVFLLKKTM